MRNALLHSLMLLLILPISASAQQPPDPVRSIRERTLPKEDFAEMAEYWEQHMQENGESAEGHLNVGQALRYAGEKRDVYLRHYMRALELEPNSVRALELAGFHTWSKGDSTEKRRGREMLEKAKSLDTKHHEVLYSLYSVYCCEGLLDEAAEIALDIYRRNVIPQPIQDFGYNMLMGLPQNAVVITNGDNDTYPPISLQAGRNLRDDVVILNKSLLSCEEYADALYQRYSDWFPKKPKRDGPLGAAQAVIEHLLKTKKRPVYAAVTVDYQGQPHSITLEGLCARIDALEGEELRVLYEKIYHRFRDDYRLDSASFWKYPWALRNAEQMMMKNYVALAYMAADEARNANDQNALEFLITKGRHIAAFHEMEQELAIFDELSRD